VGAIVSHLKKGRHQESHSDDSEAPSRDYERDSISASELEVSGVSGCAMPGLTSPQPMRTHEKSNTHQAGKDCNVHYFPPISGVGAKWGCCTEVGPGGPGLDGAEFTTWAPVPNTQLPAATATLQALDAPDPATPPLTTSAVKVAMELTRFGGHGFLTFHAAREAA
jgi:hypothetical protein